MRIVRFAKSGLKTMPTKSIMGAIAVIISSMGNQREDGVPNTFVRANTIVLVLPVDGQANAEINRP